MNRKSLVVGLAVGVSASLAPCYAQITSAGKAFEPYPELKQIIVPPPSMPVDDYMLALAKAGHLNFIADARRIDPAIIMPDYPAAFWPRVNNFKPRLSTVMKDFTRACHLGQLQYNSTTFLFWNGHNSADVGQLIYENGLYWPTAAPPDATQLYRELEEYASRVHGWSKEPLQSKVTNQQFGVYQVNLGRRELRGKLKDLPPELENKLVALASYERWKTKRGLDAWLNEDFWQTARVREGALGRFDPRYANLRLIPANLPKRSLYIAGVDAQGRAIPYYNIFNGPIEALREPAISAVQLVNDDATTVPEPKEAEVLPFQLQPGSTSPYPVPELVAAIAKAEPIARGAVQSALDADPDLAAPMKFDAVRLPLNQVLQQAQQQSGVTLALSPSIEATAPLTLHVENLTLGRFMGALGRLYQFSWQKQAKKSYLLVENPKPQLAPHLQTLWQVALQKGQDFGNSSNLFNPKWEEYVNQPNEVNGWLLEQEALQAVENDPRLHSAQGVPFTDLPEDVQARLKQSYKGAANATLAGDFFQRSLHLTPESVVHLEQIGNDLATSNPKDLLRPENRPHFELQIKQADDVLSLIPDRVTLAMPYEEALTQLETFQNG